MALDRRVIEQLLYEHEGKALDFKAEHYALTSAQNATPESKAKFIKDLLAFANTARDGDAYILIGVDEKTRDADGRAKVLGQLATVYDDATLQQQLSGKTTADVVFEYGTVDVDGGTVAVIRILKEQPFPISMRADFGGLRESAVYCRRGSSTRQMTPTEVFELGKQASAPARPAVRITLGSKAQHESKIRWQVHSVVLERAPSSMPSTMKALHDAKHKLLMMSTKEALANFGLPPDKDIEAHVAEVAILQPVDVRVQNLGPASVREAKLILSVPQLPNLRLCKRLPPAPRTVHYMMAGAEFEGPSIEPIGDREWQVTYGVGRLSAHDQHWGSRIWIGSAEPCEVPITARLLGDGLSPPIVQQLVVEISPEAGDLASAVERYKKSAVRV